MITLSSPKSGKISKFYQFVTSKKQIAAYEITAKEVLGLRQRTEKLESTYKTFRTSGVKGYG